MTLNELVRNNIDCRFYLVQTGIYLLIDFSLLVYNANDILVIFLFAEL